MAEDTTSGGMTPISAAPRRCPNCGKPATPQHRPFCSRRCAQIDLGRWLNGNYRVETEEGPESDGEPDER